MNARGREAKGASGFWRITTCRLVEISGLLASFLSSAVHAPHPWLIGLSLLPILPPFIPFRPSTPPPSLSPFLTTVLIFTLPLCSGWPFRILWPKLWRPTGQSVRKWVDGLDNKVMGSSISAMILLKVHGNPQSDLKQRSIHNKPRVSFASARTGADFFLADFFHFTRYHWLYKGLFCLTRKHWLYKGLNSFSFCQKSVLYKRPIHFLQMASRTRKQHCRQNITKQH